MLDSELRKCIKKVSGFNFIHHKFITTVYTGSDMEDEHYNNLLLHRQKTSIHAFLNHDFTRFVFTHERPYRLEAFLECFPFLKFNPPEAGRLAMDVWTDSENVYVNYEAWVSIFTDFIPDRNDLMTITQQMAFNELPETLTIYRGSTHEKGLSWTLSKEKAQWFADRFKQKGGQVFERTVNKYDCLCYTDARNEQEIIYIGDFDD